MILINMDPWVLVEMVIFLDFLIYKLLSIMICLNLKMKELWLMLKAKVIILSLNCPFLSSLFLLDTIMENDLSLCKFDEGNVCLKFCF